MNRNGQSRNAFANGRGIGENRLRPLEGPGNILPRWDESTEEKYGEVVAGWFVLKEAGWSTQRVRKFFEVVRSNNFPAGARAAFRAHADRLREEVKPHWKGLSPGLRKTFVETIGDPFSEEPVVLCTPLDEGDDDA
jgi:hypothetical protein